MQNGKALGFGIVEYATADQAETAQFAVNGHTLQGTNIRVSFCIPGEKAIDIYNKMMTTVVRLPGLLSNSISLLDCKNATFCAIKTLIPLSDHMLLPNSIQAPLPCTFLLCVQPC